MAKMGGIHGKRYRGAARHPGKSARTAEKRFIAVRLSEFACEALSLEGKQGDERVPSRLARAIRCYLNDKGSRGPGWAYPPFMRRRVLTDGVGLELSIEGSLWRSFEEEAESQSVTVEQLLQHAALYFAAEVNAGRLTERILDDLDDD